MSQSKLAREIGVTYQQVQKYENGTDRIGAGRLYQVATATAHPIEFFFNFGADDETASGGSESPLADNAIQKLLAAASSIKTRALIANLAAIAETFAASEENTKV